MPYQLILLLSDDDSWERASEQPSGDDTPKRSVGKHQGPLRALCVEKAMQRKHMERKRNDSPKQRRRGCADPMHVVLLFVQTDVEGVRFFWFLLFFLVFFFLALCGTFVRALCETE